MSSPVIVYSDSYWDEICSYVLFPAGNPVINLHARDARRYVTRSRVRKVNMSHWIGAASPVDAGMTDFKECLKLLRDGEAGEALLHARRALGTAPKNPFYLSYTGLLAAIAERRFVDGESLCREALGLRHNHAQLYLNLAEVYVQAGRTPDAIQTLEKGMISAGRDFRIRRALEKIGTRREPVFSFLDRGHPLNRRLGKLRHRMSGPSKAA